MSASPRARTTPTSRTGRTSSTCPCRTRRTTSCGARRPSSTCASRTPIVEFRRALRPGGEAWLTAPFFYEEHEKPWDFWRFSRYGWAELAQRADLEVVEIEPMEGFYGMLAYALLMGGRQLPDELAEDRRAMTRMSKRFAELDLADKRTDIGMCKNYQVILRRPVDRAR